MIEVSKSVKHPSLLVTNSDLWKNPHPAYFSLAMAKAAQRILVQTLNMQYAEKGIYIGLISVCGVVSPEFEFRNPTNIANETWKFFETAKPTDLEIEIRERDQ